METIKNLPISKYISFYSNVYRDIPEYKYTDIPILKMLNNKKGPFSDHAEVLLIAVSSTDGIAAAATLITTQRYPETLQVAFFEALPHKFEEVEYMFDYIKSYALSMGKQKIIIGLNGHVNYGMGILCNRFDSHISFGTKFNPHYYEDYFTKLKCKEYLMLSFLMDMNKYNLDKEKKLLERVGRNFTIREADFSNFQREVEIYTYLNNLCFKKHMFYYERCVDEDYELLEELKGHISGKSLLIAEKDNEPIGYMLWYPDFNQREINRFIISELGVVPEYQGSGAVLGLFLRCFELVRGKYDFCETSWILHENLRSKGFGYRWGAEEYKRYKVFEVSL
ncbi:MAG TPA: GNAT family N-acetyltransferase [Pseudobacteroides sp.]|uniref:GNAT family N-acetyltransferase n=1 Tax=Pseudobacteroides sp. TaxID=1968840 RepID=UPI002F9382AD